MSIKDGYLSYPSETAGTRAPTEAQKQSALKVRTKISAVEKQSNYDRVYETQVKQFCFQQATQHCLTDGSQNPKAPPMEVILREADQMFQWFKHGTVPSVDKTPLSSQLN